MRLEDKEQIAFIEYIRHKNKEEPFFHIPNGGKLVAAFGNKLKKMGVKAGVADLYFMRFKSFVELKTIKGSQSLAQKYFQQWCAGSAHSYYLLHGLDAAMQWYDEQCLQYEREGKRKWLTEEEIDLSSYLITPNHNN